MNRNQHSKNRQKNNNNLKVKLTWLEKRVVSAHRLEARIFRPLRKYNAFINRYKWLKLPIQLIGWGSLVYVLINIGLTNLKLAFSGLLNVESMFDAANYAWELRTTILSASPIKDQLDILLDLIFGVGSFAFILTVSDLEKIIEDAAFENKRFPTKRLIITYVSAFSSIANLSVQFIFIILLSLSLVMYLMKYQKIVSQRATNPLLFERSRLLCQEQKLLLHNGSRYHIFTGEITPPPKTDVNRSA